LLDERVQCSDGQTPPSRSIACCHEPPVRFAEIIVTVVAVGAIAYGGRYMLTQGLEVVMPKRDPLDRGKRL